jgi:hypothetical protein
MISEKEIQFSLFFQIGKAYHKAVSKSRHPQTLVILHLYFHARYISAQIAYYTIRIEEIIYKGNYMFPNRVSCRSEWPRSLKRGSAAARLLGLWVRIPPGAWMSVCCERCVLSSRGLCVGLITRPEESYREWCAWVWSWILDKEEALAQRGLLHHGKEEIEIHIPIRYTLPTLQFYQNSLNDIHF